MPRNTSAPPSASPRTGPDSVLTTTPAVPGEETADAHVAYMGNAIAMTINLHRRFDVETAASNKVFLFCMICFVIQSRWSSRITSRYSPSMVTFTVSGRLGARDDPPANFALRHL